MGREHNFPFTYKVHRFGINLLLIHGAELHDRKFFMNGLSGEVKPWIFELLSFTSTSEPITSLRQWIQLQILMRGFTSNSHKYSISARARGTRNKISHNFSSYLQANSECVFRMFTLKLIKHFCMKIPA